MNIINIFVFAVLAAVALLLARIAVRLWESRHNEERQLDASAHTVARLISRRLHLSRLLGSSLLTTMLVCGQGAWAQTTSFTVIAGEEEGTEEKPFLIESIADLNALTSDVNSGTAYEGKYFKLTTDLDYSGETFTPIGMGEESGEVDKPFKGIFDGNGKTISNIIYSDAEGVGVGLFGFIYSPAQIKNINLENCSFTGNAYVGAIVGNSAGTSNGFGVYDCTVASTVNVTGTSADDIYVGGIIGYCGNLIIQNCTSAASVSGSTCVGGIAGLLYEGTIQDCFYTGSSKFTEATTGAIAGDRGDPDNSGYEGTINLTLYDDDSEAVKNATRLGYYDGIEDVDVTISGRTLYKDESWNTLCLPFSLTSGASVLDGSTVKTLSTATFSEGTLTLNFADATAIEAGKPYIIKWTSGEDFTPTFTGVTINSAAPTDVTGTAANFHSIYTPYSTGGEDKNMLYLGADNNLYYPNAAITIGAFRAYFTLNGITAGNLPNEARRFVLNFGDGDGSGGNPACIHGVEAGEEARAPQAWYTLDGRCLSGKPAASGIYMHNGHKIVITIVR